MDLMNNGVHPAVTRRLRHRRFDSFQIHQMKTCSKCGAAKPLSEFGKYKRSKDGYDYRCKKCQRASNKQWCANNWDKKVAQQRLRCNELRDKLRHYKSEQGCLLCDEEDPGCLELHHLDPNEKDIDPANMVVAGWSWDRMMSEIAKCAVLCSNCHKKVHADRICLVP